MSEYLYILNEEGNPARCTQSQFDELIQSRPKMKIVDEKLWIDIVEGRNTITEELYGTEPKVEEPAEPTPEVVTPVEEPKEEVKKTKDELTEEHQATQAFPQLDDLMTLTNKELVEILQTIDPETTLNEKSLKADLVETIVILREDAKTAE